MHLIKGLILSKALIFPTFQSTVLELKCCELVLYENAVDTAAG